ncbi:MAG: AraC family transcriptional regulator [Clostridia bacterium]|nr:AraC family transcriptional regulator [Clostridia bacterium]
MREPYEIRFHDKPAGALPVLTKVSECCYCANEAVRFAAGGEYRLLVMLEGQESKNTCLLRPGQTVLFTFPEAASLCDISFQGSESERLFQLPQDKPAFFDVGASQMISDAARAAADVPESCSASLYRSAQLLRIFSCFPAAEEETLPDDCGKRAMQFIRENYMRPINVNDIALAVGVSRSWLYRCFMDYTEQSPAMFLRDIRLQRAKSLLQHTSLSVQEIAHAVGYEDPLYFSRTFSDYFGCAPSIYRKNAALF